MCTMTCSRCIILCTSFAIFAPSPCILCVDVESAVPAALHQSMARSALISSALSSGVYESSFRHGGTLMWHNFIRCAVCRAVRRRQRAAGHASKTCRPEVTGPHSP